MDFPIDLTTHQFVTGEVQYKQDIQLLFDNVIHSFLQDWSLGTTIDIHAPNEDENSLRFAIEDTVKQLSNTELISCKINRTGINSYDAAIRLLYNGELISYTFTTNENS